MWSQVASRQWKRLVNNLGREVAARTTGTHATAVIGLPCALYVLNTTAWLWRHIITPTPQKFSRSLRLSAEVCRLRLLKNVTLQLLFTVEINGYALQMAVLRLLLRVVW
jgi:hypothetical protein